MDVKKKKVIGIVSVLVLLLLCLLGYQLLSKGQKYRRVTYSVRYVSDTLITAEDLKDYVAAHAKPVVGQLKRNVSLPQLEGRIRRWPYVDSVNISTDIRGGMHIEAVQANVILRVMNTAGQSYYIAKIGNVGRILPYLPDRPVRTLVASGNIRGIHATELIQELQDTSVAYDLMLIASQIDASVFWKALVGQIYVKAKGNYLLVPTVGTHLIELGDASQLDRKFDNLWNIYTQGFNVTGWQRYAKVSLQYGDRVPCKKRII